MRRIGPILSISCLALFASCTKAPEVTKAQNVGEVQAADSGGAGTVGGLPAIPDGPVAIVNGKEITSADFHGIYDLKLQKYEDRGREIPKTADRRYRKSIVDRLIYQEILRQEAAKQKIDYDKPALAEREEAQQRGIKDWDKHLRRRGESEDSLRQLYVAELLERGLLEAEGLLAVSEAEIEEEYEKVKPNYNKDKERVRAAHILIRVGPDERPAPGEPIEEPDEAQKKQWETDGLAKANEIYAKAMVEGADFEALAIEVSEGPSARKGGDLGIFSADRMVDEFSDAAFVLEPGEISKPIKTKFGFHIIKVHGKYPPGDLPREALEDQIVERLSARKLHQGRRDLKEKLMAAYEVKNIMEDLLGPDPRAQRRKQNRERQGHPPGAKPTTHGAPSGGPSDAHSPTAPSTAPPASPPAGTANGAGEATAEVDGTPKKPAAPAGEPKPKPEPKPPI